MSRLLLVEDDKWLSDLYKSALKRVKGLKIIHADSANKALKLMDDNAVDLIVLDIFLDQHNGIELLHEFASYDDTRHVPVIILSAVAERDFGMSKKRWAEYGVVQYLYKPETKPADLIAEVKKQFASIKHERVHETTN